MPTLLSLGHGYSAAALARLLIPQGWTVIGTTRNAAKADALRATGVQLLLWPGDLGPALARATHILASAAPDAQGDPFLRRPPASPPPPRNGWVICPPPASTATIRAAGWTRTTPLTPASDRGRWRVLAEDQWRATGLPLHVFRLAGIYGPGRGPFEKVRDGTARRIIKPGQVFSASMSTTSPRCWPPASPAPTPARPTMSATTTRPRPKTCWPKPPACWACPNRPPFPIDQAEMTPMARSFYAESKRVRNDRIKTELGVTLRYPDYRAGLRGLLGAE
jgi:hypothetical protein